MKLCEKTTGTSLNFKEHELLCIICHISVHLSHVQMINKIGGRGGGEYFLLLTYYIQCDVLS